MYLQLNEELLLSVIYIYIFIHLPLYMCNKNTQYVIKDKSVDQ